MMTELSREQDKLLTQVGDEWLSYLLEPRTIDRNALTAGLWRFCEEFRLNPDKIVLVEGPIEAQAYFLRNSRPGSGPRKESALQRQILRRVWGPAIREMESKVGSYVSHHVETQLGRAFFRIMRELEHLLMRNLMSNCLGSGLASDVYACAFLDFFTRIGAVNNTHFESWRTPAAMGLWGSILQDGIFIGVLPPSQGQIRQGQRHELSLHSTTCSALSWRDGTKSYWIRGTPICKDLFEEPDKLPLYKIYNEWDPLTKQEMISILGIPRFLRKTRVRVIDKDLDRSDMPRRLLRVQVSPWDHWCMVEVKCPSKGDLHYLWVPPEMERCSQAVAWTFGFDVDHYQPLVEA